MLWNFAMRWQLEQWLCSMGEQKNPISSIDKVKRKIEKKISEKKWGTKGKNNTSQLRPPQKKKKKAKEEIQRDRCGGGGRPGKSQDREKKRKKTWASWLLNMRLFYRRAVIEWKCDKNIDIVFRHCLVAVAPMKQQAELPVSLVMACHWKLLWWMAMLDWNRRAIYIRLVFSPSLLVPLSPGVWRCRQQKGWVRNVMEDNIKLGSQTCYDLILK